MSEIYYIENYICKAQDINLSDDEISEYDMSGVPLHCKKTKNDGSTCLKYYNFQSANKFDNLPNGIKEIGWADYDTNQAEYYFSLTNGNSLIDLAKAFDMVCPISGILFDDFDKSFESWRLELATVGESKPVVASIKFDENEVACLMKLYRGNYTPTDEEIESAKEYWKSVPS